MLKNDEIVSLCQNYIDRAENYSGSALASNRDQATDYYLGRLTGRAPDPGYAKISTPRLSGLVLGWTRSGDKPHALRPTGRGR